MDKLVEIIQEMARNIRECPDGRCTSCNRSSDLIVECSDSLQQKLTSKDAEIKELESILLELGAETHTNKRLHEWYCENKE